MNYWKNVVILVAVVCLSGSPLSLYAQPKMSVASFRMLENDLTANRHGTMETDQNGEVAALIKVVTTEQGFVFDGGSLGIVKVKQNVGEIWVYVPQRLQRITIQHQQLGVLRDYYFPIPIESARTYELVLTTGRVVSHVVDAARKQFVEFYVSPKDAVVELNDEPLSVDANGYAAKSVVFGTYNYRVMSPNYHTKAGNVTVDNPNEKAVLRVNLKPNFGWLQVESSSSSDSAVVYVDNARVGQIPFTTGALKSGKHRVKITKPLYKMLEQDITIADSAVFVLTPELEANFAISTFKVDADAEIWIDGVRKGIRSWSGPLDLGEYQVECRMEGHHSSSQLITVRDNEAQTFSLLLPTPRYGGLEIVTSPSEAEVFLDGASIGRSPLILNEVLMGNHQLEFRRKDYRTETRSITIAEGKTENVRVTLSDVCKVSISSKPVGARLYIKDEYKGTTPFTTEMSSGDYPLKLTARGYQDYNKVTHLDGSSTVEIALKKSYFKKSEFYVEGDFQMGGLPSYGFSLGTFLGALNVELTYLYGMQTSEDIYKNYTDADSWPGVYYYQPSYLGLRVGWALRAGNRWRFTPRVGLGTVVAVDAKDAAFISSLGDPCTRANTATVDVKSEFALLPWMSLCVTPGFDFSLTMQDYYTALDKISPKFQGWRSGLNVRAGLRVYF